MKHTFIALLLGAVTALCRLSANYECGARCSVGAEFLYFQPLLDNSYFVVQDPVGDGLANAHRSANKFSWTPAFRVQANCTLSGCSGAELRYTYLHATRIRNNKEFTANGVNLHPTTGFETQIWPTVSGFAHSKIAMTYQAVDTLLGRLVYENSYVYLTAKAGLHWACFNHLQHIHFDNFEPTTPNVGIFAADLRHKNEIWGIGPELALHAEYEVPEIFSCALPLTLSGDFRTALLISQDRGKFQQTIRGVNPAVNASLENADIWRVIPMWDLRFGIAYEPNFRCNFDTRIEIGYEILSYHRASHFTRMTQTFVPEAAWSFDEYSDVAFHGPYFAVDIGF